MSNRSNPNQTLMKQLLIVVALFTIISCDSNQEPRIVSENDTDSKIISFLMDDGYFRSSIDVRDSIVILAKDGFMTKSNIEALIKERDGRDNANGRTKHYTTTIVPTDVSSIYITLDNDLKSGWSDALSKAVQNWNNVSGSRVEFKYSKDVIWRQTDIYIQWDPEQAALNDAVASFPTRKYTGLYSFYVLVGKDIYVNETNPNLTFDLKTAILMHELGHCLGFRHTNYWFVGESAYPDGAVLVPGTNNDFGGVFATNPQVPVFSANDSLAIRTLWPK
jgi:hypothetical protein